MVGNNRSDHVHGVGVHLGNKNILTLFFIPFFEIQATKLS